MDDTKGIRLPRRLGSLLVGLILVLLVLYLWIQYTKPAASPLNQQYPSSTTSNVIQ